MEEIVVIIPAYNPDKTLIKMVNELKKYYKIIVINDGSDDKYQNIFNTISKDVILKTHKINEGKGNALKTGMKECIKQNGEIKGIITADADGQHTIEDIKKAGEALIKHDCMILGVRDTNKMPIKNKLGNKISNNIIKIKYKVNITDTQTGLRAIPQRYINTFSEIKGNRFNYETEMIKYILLNKEPFKEIKIDTIYDKSIKTKFKTIKDSFDIVITAIKK